MLRKALRWANFLGVSLPLTLVAGDILPLTRGLVSRVATVLMLLCGAALPLATPPALAASICTHSGGHGVPGATSSNGVAGVRLGAQQRD